MNQDSILISVLILLAGFISIELHVSTAMLEIIAGVVGSNVLNLHSFSWLDFLADFGLLGIMFLAGFEVDPKLLRSNLSRNLVIGTSSYIFPFLSIFDISFFVLKNSFETTLILSISLSTTSLALVYAVMRDRGIINTPYGQVMLGSALITDVLSVLSLTVLIGNYGLYTIIYGLVALLFMILSPKIGKIIFKRYKGSPAEIEIKFILLLLLIMPFFSKHVGISEAVFAFLLGILFSEMIEEDIAVQEKLRGIIFGFLAPAFFFKAGLLMKFSHLTQIGIYLIIILGFIAYLSKYIVVFITTRIYMNSHLASMNGLFCNFRLSFGVIAAIFGLNAGILTTELYTVVLTIILLASTISSIALKIIPHEIPETW